MITENNVYDFGAIGDGIADDTSAIQAAIDKAYENGLPVKFPEGTFSVGELFVKEGVSLKATPQWGYSYTTMGRSVLKQRFEDQKAVLNITEARGSTIDGLSLMGSFEDGFCCGILYSREAFAEKEDAFRIERCRVARFSGHAVYLKRVWCFSLRHNMFCFSKGDGVRLHGWDGFVSDNWFSGNSGCGFSTEEDNCSVTMTGNRIEWNNEAGISIKGGSHYNITGNYIDRSGKYGILLEKAVVIDEYTRKAEPRIVNTATVTGNIVYRSGKSAKTNDENCHIYMDGCAGVSVIGNSLCVGRDDRGKGEISPKTAVIVQRLKDSIISGNTMFMGATESLVEDRKNHLSNVIIEKNEGSLYPQSAYHSSSEGLPTNIIIEYDDGINSWFK